jgi:phosphatidylglycerophosphate synthase
MDLRRSRLGQGYYALLQAWVMPWLQRTRLSPNELTAVGVFFAALVPVGFFYYLPAGLIFLALSAVTDTLDGFLARAKGSEGSSFGAFWDSTLDRVSDCFYLLGFWILFWKALEDPFWPSLLLFLALLGTGLISYTKARIEGLGGECAAGLMDRLVRTIYFFLWGLTVACWPSRAEGALWAGLAAYLLLVGLTVLQRVRQAARTL